MKERFISFMLRYQRWFYGLAIVVVLAIFGGPLVMKYFNRRVKYNWNEYNISNNPHSKDPFGTYYVDEYLRNAWKGKFEVDSTVMSALKKHSNERCNYLFYDTENSFANEQDSIKLYIDRLKKGSNFIFSGYLQDFVYCTGVTLSSRNTNFYIGDFNKEETTVYREPIGIHSGSKEHFTDTCSVWSVMHTYNFEYRGEEAEPEFNSYWYFDIPEGVNERTLVDSLGYCMAMTVRIGKGKVLFNGTRCLLNNYAIGYPELWKLNEKILYKTFDKSLPLVVVYKADQYEGGVGMSGEDGALEEIIENKPTAWALYILLVLLFFALIINSRRRRRAEEAIPQEHNSSIGYVEHLATLYTSNTDYKELLVLEQRKLLYRFRKEFRFDIRTSGFTLPSEYAEIVAESKGYDKSEVKFALVKLESFTSAEGTVDCDTYKDCMKTLIEALQKKD